MIKYIIKKVVYFLQNTFLRKYLLFLGIYLNNFSYTLIKLFISKPGRLAPKYQILDLFNFFRSKVNKNDTVLDIGCGNGLISYKLSKKAKRVIGIEILGFKVKSAKKKYNSKNLTYIKGDATSYDFTKFGIETFDKVILSNVLEHIENRIHFLKKIKPFSKKIILRVPMITRDWLSYYKRENGYEYRLDPTHYIEYTEEELFDEVDKSGWIIENYEIKFGEFYGVLKHRK